MRTDDRELGYDALLSEQEGADGGHEVVQSCSVNCGSRCLLRFHVRNGDIRWVESDAHPEKDGEPAMRACLRGRASRYWLASPDRLNHPLRRVGKRGSGNFERISWDEALDTVAAQIERISRDYGNDAILMTYATGAYTAPSSPFRRLLNCCGGYLDTYGDYSCAQLQAGMGATFGDDGYHTGSTLSEAARAEVVVMFGSNPLDTRMGGGSAANEFLRAREEGAFKLYSIDPRHSDVVNRSGDVWVPIRPGTDAALVAALCHILITEDGIDREFLDRCCVGYDRSTMPDGVPSDLSYEDYILGTGPDGVEKTPEWASRITRIPVRVIEELGRDIVRAGRAKKLFVVQGWGPQRSEMGETTSRAICMLAILTGSIGLPGTNAGMRERFIPFVIPDAPVGENPIEAKIPVFTWLEAVEHGRELTKLRAAIRGADRLKVPVKMIVNHAGNCLTNQHADINHVHEVLSDETACEFIVGIDIMMTDSMRYADIILPDLARAEGCDLVSSGNADMHRALIKGGTWDHETFERRSAWSMARDLAIRLGVGDAFMEGLPQDLDMSDLRLASAHTEGEERKDAWSSAPVPKSARSLDGGVWRARYTGPTVAYEQFRRDPSAFPLDTPSGRIEIFSHAAYELSRALEEETGERIPALPVYVPSSDETDEDAKRRFPFQLIGYHGRQSTHSSYANVEELQRVSPRELMVNALDAERLGILSGEAVVVENERGAIVVRVRATPRVMPGVVALAQGAWHDADMDGSRLDWGGCINTLTSAKPTAWARANAHNTCRVAIRHLSTDEIEEMVGRGW